MRRAQASGGMKGSLTKTTVETPPTDAKSFRAWARAWLIDHPIEQCQRNLGQSMLGAEKDHEDEDYQLPPAITFNIEFTLTAWDWKELIEDALEEKKTVHELLNRLFVDNCEIHRFSDESPDLN